MDLNPHRKEVKRLKELFTIVGTIAINNKKANKALDETTEKGKSTSKTLSDRFGSVGNVLANVGAKATDVGAKVVKAGAKVAVTVAKAGAEAIKVGTVAVRSSNNSFRSSNNC